MRMKLSLAYYYFSEMEKIQGIILYFFIQDLLLIVYISAKNINQLRASTGPYGSNDSNNIYKNANLKTNKYLGQKEILFSIILFFIPLVFLTPISLLNQIHIFLNMIGQMIFLKFIREKPLI